MLESLENREVPSAANASAAFNNLPTDMNNLVASMQARPADPNAIGTNINTVASAIFLLSYSARNFVVSDRLQIDNALIIQGITLFFQSYNNIGFIPSNDFVAAARLGAFSVREGIVDFLTVGFFPQSSDDAVLT